MNTDEEKTYWVLNEIGQYQQDFDSLEDAIRYIFDYQPRIADIYGGWRIEDDEQNEIEFWETPEYERIKKEYV